MAQENIGKIVQVIGPVIDVKFPAGQLPDIYFALRVPTNEGDIVVEVAQHLGEGMVKCVSMKPTDGLVRGMPVYDTGKPISVPVGPEVLGRILNVLGEPVDEKGPVITQKT